MKSARLRLGLMALVILVACGDRTIDMSPDYTADVERICHNLCDKIFTCVDEPNFGTEAECRLACTDTDVMYEDSECGRAVRAFRECTSGTTTCADYLDTMNVTNEDYLCKQENEVLAGLTCFGAEGSD